MSMKENEIDRILADLVAGERISAEDRQSWKTGKRLPGGILVLNGRFGK